SVTKPYLYARLLSSRILALSVLIADSSCVWQDELIFLLYSLAARARSPRSSERGYAKPVGARLAGDGVLDIAIVGTPPGPSSAPTRPAACSPPARAARSAQVSAGSRSRMSSPSTRTSNCST